MSCLATISSEDVIKGIAEWKRIDAVRESLTEMYWKRVYREVKRLAAPILEAVKKSQSLPEAEAVATNQRVETARMEILFEKMYIHAGQVFGKMTVESLKSEAPYYFMKSQHDVEVEVGDTFFITTMKKYAELYGAEKVKLISDTNRAIIREIIRNAIKQGDSVDKAAERIRDHFIGDITKNRSVMIARTEIMSASSHAQLETGFEIERMGLPLKKKWLPTPRPVNRPHHLAMAGKPPIGLRDRFLVGGIYMMRPHDPEAPASEVVNCRCTVTFHPV